jgi:periplasmic divalent cation tolerance protein
MSEALVIFCTCPDQDTAARLASGLVERRLAACVNVLPGIRSIYRWQEGISEDEEVLMVIKAMNAGFPALEEWLSKNHPYDVPEIVAMPVSRISAGYRDWIEASTVREEQA